MADVARNNVHWKREPLFRLVEKIRLWPSRRGVLHGIKSFERSGDCCARIVTHCNEQAVIRNSKSSHAARWLRNKWQVQLCGRCAIPEWKVEKYAATVFKSGRVASQLRKQAAKAPEVRQDGHESAIGWSKASP